MVETLEKPAICIDASRWGAAMTRWQRAEYRAKTEWQAYADKPKHTLVSDMLYDMAQQSSDEEADAHNALMEALPSPDLGALRWKLDQIFRGESDDEYMPSWSWQQVRQTMEDYKRLLPESL